MSDTDPENDINLISNLGIHEDDDIDLSDTSNNLFDLHNFNNFRFIRPNKYDIEREIDPETYLYNEPNCQYYTEEQFNSKVNMKQSLSVIHFNSRSLWKNFVKIKDYLNSFPKFSIVAVSETWLDKDKVSDVELDGYELFVMNREDKKGGGVAIYVDSNLQSNLVNNMSTTIDNVLECVTVEVKIEKQKKCNC